MSQRESWWEFDEVLKKVPRGSRLFEYGCGTGAFLRRCREEDVRASGMDSSPEAVAQCAARGFDVVCAALDQLPPTTQPGKFTFLAAFQLIQHLDDPAHLFAHAAAQSQKEAHLWLSAPSNCRSQRLPGSSDSDPLPPLQVTPEALRDLGIRHGWRLTETMYEPISLRAAIQSIVASSARHKRWKAAGRLNSAWSERLYRIVALPIALARRLSIDRSLSGYAMLMHFVRTQA